MIVAALVLAASAQTCGKPEYSGFAVQAKAARKLLVKLPAQALAQFQRLDARDAACRSTDKRPDAQFKLLLFHVGLQGFMGAARAELGEIARGRAMVDAAERRAQALLRAQTEKSGRRSLVQALIEQLTIPQDVIARLGKP